jgi:hypothetical protein
MRQSGERALRPVLSTLQRNSLVRVDLGAAFSAKFDRLFAHPDIILLEYSVHCVAAATEACRESEIGHPGAASTR